jgi:hypothetical protein
VARRDTDHLSLRDPYVPALDPVSILDPILRDLAALPRSIRGGREADMLDLLYLAIGIGVFALFAGYAAALRRI